MSIHAPEIPKVKKYAPEDVGDLLQALIPIPVHKRTSPLSVFIWNKDKADYEEAGGLALQILEYSSGEQHVVFLVDPK